MGYITKQTHNGRIRIAFLIRGVGSGAGTEIWRGIMHAAEKADADLITLYGGPLGKTNGNVIYDLANQENIDGIISWASSADNEYSRYFRKYDGIPLVTLSIHLEGYPVVSIDSYSGMKAATDHLVKDHGCRKIAFIRGPEEHIYAKERYQAYLDTLRENDIPFDERLVSPYGNFRPDDGVQAYRQFIKEQGLKPGKDLEAVVGVSDQSAVAFMEQAKQDGYRIPRDLAVVGCNYSDAAISSDPGVTSVAMPFFEQGMKAAQLVMEMISGKEIPETTFLPARLMKLQSCGCSLVGSVTSKKADSSSTPGKSKFRQADEGHILSEVQRNELAEKISARICDKLETLVLESTAISEFCQEAITAFSNIESETAQQTFLAVLVSALRATLDANGRTEAWHELLTELSIYVSRIDCDLHCKVEALGRLEKGRLIVSEYIKREYFSMYSEADWRINRIRDLSGRLFSSKSLEELDKVLSPRMAAFGIDGYFVVLYRDPKPYMFMDPLAERSVLSMGGISSGEISGQDGLSVEFRTEAMLPEPAKRKLGTLNLLIIPLFRQETQIGYFILQNPPTRSHIYHMFGDTLSSSIHNIMLFEELDGIKGELEKTLTVLKNKADIISGNSREISIRVNEVSDATGDSAGSIRDISDRITNVLNITREAVTLGQKVNTLVSQLTDHSEKIGGFSKVIYEIAEQTNVLSINAAIEAARAGDMGRGFAVVAREIKELSKQTVSSTEEINQMIALIQKSTSMTGQHIMNMIQIVEKISDHSGSITDAIQKQSQTITNISELLSTAAEGSNDIAKEISEVARLGSGE